MLNNFLLKSYLQEKSNELIIIRMLIGFGVAIFWVTPSLFLNSMGFSNSLIGYILAVTTFISLVISLISTISLEKYDEYKLFIFSLFTPFLFLFLLIFFPNISIYILFLIISAIFSTIRNNSFSIVFRDITKNSEYTKKESLMYSLLNVGWFIGPFIGGLLIDNYGFQETFALTIFFYFIALVLSLFLKIKLKKKKRVEIDFNLIKNIKFYLKQKELIKSYFITFSSSVWYVLIFTFVPLFIVENNLGGVWVGIFLSFTQFPLIFIQFKLNWFIKKFGLKKLLIYSYSYLSLVSLVLFFYSEIYFTIIVLSTTAFALSFIEPLREIYFFKNVNCINEEKTYPIFNTSFSLGSIFGKILLSYVLMILPNNYVYITISILMALTVLLAFNLKSYNN